ncbi:MAG: hypothetical protein PF508_06960, partial [Spirochaeta sp.]|nr:hypothetical protein [Spirochaeta sp.]
TGCASVGDRARGGEGATTGVATDDDAAMRALARPRTYSPWPVVVDRGFREGAVLATDELSFSHPAGWYFQPVAEPVGPAAFQLDVQVYINRTTPFAAADAGRKLALMSGGGRLTGRVIAAPLNDAPDVSAAARFLQWVAWAAGDDASDDPDNTAATGDTGPATATVVWSDESVTTPSANDRQPRPLYLALIRPGADADDTLYAIAWQRLAEREIVVELAGPGDAVRDTIPDLIRLAKTVAPGAPATAATRRLPGGLQFSDPTGAWRWTADLSDGFIVTATEPPRVRVAVWHDDEVVRFQEVSADADAVTDPRVVMLLRDATALRGTARGGER